MTIRSLSLAFIAFWFFLALYFMQQGLALKLGSVSNPEAGFMPFVIGILLAGFCIASGLPLLRPKETLQAPSIDLKMLVGPAIVVVTMITYALTLERIGFVICTSVAIVFLARAVGKTTLVSAVTLAVVATAACYLVFGMLLRVRLP